MCVGGCVCVFACASSWVCQRLLIFLSEKPCPQEVINLSYRNREGRECSAWTNGRPWETRKRFCSALFSLLVSVGCLLSSNASTDKCIIGGSHWAMDPVTINACTINSCLMGSVSDIAHSWTLCGRILYQLRDSYWNMISEATLLSTVLKHMLMCEEWRQTHQLIV